jgi:hypothetical protein
MFLDKQILLLLLLLFYDMVEKLSHHCSGIPEQSDGVLEYLLVVQFGMWHTVH